jgi:hypothetical protein
MTPGLPSWPTTLQPFTLVTSPRLGLRHAHFKCYLFGTIVVTYEIRVFFEGVQKEVFSSILKFENVNT